MSQYRVLVSKSAAKELSRLQASINNRIVKAVLTLSEDPRPKGSKKLRGSSKNWRIRIGDYSVIYSIDDEILIVDVRKVGHRKDIYE